MSRGYFENVNRSNTVINNTVINNYYNNTNVTNVVYANRQVPGAVVAVPTTAFVQSQPVSQGGGAGIAGDGCQRAGGGRRRPSRRPREACVAPPPRATSRLPACSSGPSSPAPRPRPAPVGFAAQQQQLAAKPGQAARRRRTQGIEACSRARAGARRQSGRADAKSAADHASASGRPPAPRRAMHAEDPMPKGPRSPRDFRRTGRAAARRGAGSAAPPQVVPAAPAAQPQEQRGKAEQPGKAKACTTRSAAAATATRGAGPAEFRRTVHRPQRATARVERPRPQEVAPLAPPRSSVEPTPGHRRRSAAAATWQPPGTAQTPGCSPLQEKRVQPERRSQHATRLRLHTPQRAAATAAQQPAQRAKPDARPRREASRTASACAAPTAAPPPPATQAVPLAKRCRRQQARRMPRSKARRRSRSRRGGTQEEG